jgi:hypothetical protein
LLCCSPARTGLIYWSGSFYLMHVGEYQTPLKLWKSCGMAVEARISRVIEL